MPAMPRRESRREQVLPPVRHGPAERIGGDPRITSAAVPDCGGFFRCRAPPRCAQAHVADALGVYRRRRTCRDRAARRHWSRSIPHLEGAGRDSERPRWRSAARARLPSHLPASGTKRTLDITAGSTSAAAGDAAANPTGGNHTTSGDPTAHQSTGRARPAAGNDTGAGPTTRAGAADPGSSAADAGTAAAAGGTAGPRPATAADGVAATSAPSEPPTAPAPRPGGDAGVPGSSRRVYD